MNEYKLIHKTVNHSQNCVDPSTGAHTLQSIEDLWRIIKIRYNIKTKGALPLPKRQLIEEWWRLLHPSMNIIFDKFPKDLKTTFLV